MNGGGAAPSREERGVDIDAPERRNSKHFFGKNLSIRRDNGDIRTVGTKLLNRHVVEFPRLFDGNILGCGKKFYGTLDHFLIASGRFIRLRKNGDDVVVRFDE